MAFIYTTILFCYLHSYHYLKFCCCCSVARLCPTPCNPMYCSLPGCSVHGFTILLIFLSQPCYFFFILPTRTYTPYVSLSSQRSKHQGGIRCARALSKKNAQEGKWEGNTDLRESPEPDSSVNLMEGEKARR